MMQKVYLKLANRTIAYELSSSAREQFSRELPKYCAAEVSCGKGKIFVTIDELYAPYSQLVECFQQYSQT